jgi:hypothetical protein
MPLITLPFSSCVPQSRCDKRIIHISWGARKYARKHLKQASWACALVCSRAFGVLCVGLTLKLSCADRHKSQSSPTAKIKCQLHRLLWLGWWCRRRQRPTMSPQRSWSRWLRSCAPRAQAPRLTQRSDAPKRA